MVSYKTAAGIGVVAGLGLNVGQGLTALGRVGNRIDFQIQRDCHLLQTTGMLEPLPPPAPARKLRSPMGMAILGAGLTGAAFGIITCVIIIATLNSGGGPVGQSLIVGPGIGLVVGIGTAIMPGLLIGLALQRAAIGHRNAAQAETYWTQFAQDREQIRQSLTYLQITPPEAAQRIRALLPAD